MINGNLVDGDCCSSSCTFEPPGTACGTVANLCLTASCTGAGSCQIGARPPRPTCRQSTAARAGRLQLQNRSDDWKDRLDWMWGTGAITPKSAFGSPTTTTDDGLCIYAAAGQLIMSAIIPAGRLCNPSQPLLCWKSTSSGFRYGDPALSADGVNRVMLGQGLQDGKAKIIGGGKGMGLGMPVLPIAPVALPLRAQLEAGNGECWVATYGAFISHNTAETFSAKSD